jgi:arsenate reductase (glutaredoxin)
MITIYHNPKCSKSRECLAFIENSKAEFEIIKYLETPFTFKKLKSIINKLKIKPIELVRTKESIWIHNYQSLTLTDDEVIQAMIDNPILIERPIAVKGRKAIIARPLEKITKLL